MIQINVPNKNVEYNFIIYSINEEEKTANIIGFNPQIQSEVIIPQFIINKSKEYIVINILQKAFYDSSIKSLKFDPNSKLQVICKEAFLRSSIEAISFPSQLVNLKKGWCRWAYNITKVSVNPENQRFKSFDDKFILKKSSIEQAEYDSLFFCVRDIETFTVPTFIKHISSFAFEGCSLLKSIDIPDDSKLQSIGREAFSETSIESITFPSNLIELKDGWCKNVRKLNNIKISQNNPRYKVYEDKFIIGKSSIEHENYDCLVFCVRNIEEVTVPNFIEHICSFAFDECFDLKTIEIPNDSKLKTIGDFAFKNTSIERVVIPSQVEQIGEGAFHSCSQLQRIEIPSDSKLKIINKRTFVGTSIESIFIPPQVTAIKEDAFSCCKKLERIEIQSDSKLQIIEDAFNSTNIESLSIPPNLIEFKNGWCFGLTKLKKIEISPDNQRYKVYDDKFIIGKSSIERENYDCLVFCVRDIRTVTIPNFIEHIYSFAFEECLSLVKLEIPADSRLQTIGSFAFCGTSFKSIKIQSHVRIIGESAFSGCNHLQAVEMTNDSKLQIIEKDAFRGTSIQSFIIPSQVTSIGDCAFSYCMRLQIIEINDNSNIKLLNINVFEGSDNVIVMIPLQFRYLFNQ